LYAMASAQLHRTAGDEPEVLIDSGVSGG
jgi:hypothetical protein